MNICPSCNQEIKEDRSSQQNKYWWKAMEIIGDELGYERTEMSIVVKKHFNWYTIVEVDGEKEKDWESSASWSKKQFSANTELLIRFAYEQGIRLLTPEEFFNSNKQTNDKQKENSDTRKSN